MKKLFALLMAATLLLGLTACFGSSESATESFSPPPTSPDGETIPWLDMIPISEIDPIFGPGPFSLNELAERFGEPVELTVNTATDRIATLTGCYQNATDNIWFELILDTDQPWHEVDPEKVDRTLSMAVYQTHVHGGDFPLPRGIRLRDSYQRVRKAYPETPYSGGHGYDDTAELFYRYEGATPGEYGIWYYFGNDRLGYVTIKWMDLYA